MLVVVFGHFGGILGLNYDKTCFISVPDLFYWYYSMDLSSQLRLDRQYAKTGARDRLKLALRWEFLLRNERFPVTLRLRKAINTLFPYFFFFICFAYTNWVWLMDTPYHFFSIQTITKYDVHCFTSSRFRTSK